jgi:Undecaprenyl-phosphate galactose phosphotransferase WbaP
MLETLTTDLSALIHATSDTRTGTLADIRVDRAASLSPLPFYEHKLIPWLLAAIDIVVVQTAMSLAQACHNTIVPWWFGLHPYAFRAGLRSSLLLVPAGCYLADLYPGYGLGPVERLRRRTIAMAIVFAGLAAGDNIFNHGLCSRSLLLLIFAVTILISPAVESASICLLDRAGWWGTPVVVLSARHAGTALASTLRQKRELGLVPVALFKTASEMWGLAFDGIPVLGPPAMAANLIDHVGAAILAMPGIKHSDLLMLVERLPFRRIIVVPELAGLQSLWVNARDLGGNLGLEMTRNLLVKRNYYLKRFTDYVFGIPLFFISLPIIGVLALWIRHVSPGPAFYTQQREGRHGKPIRIWKLRSMALDADSALERHLAAHPEEREHWNRYFKLKKDPRILPGVGHLLRRTSLDELPQLWNVIRGELSLVGPRPFPRYHMQSFPDDFCALRRSVMPGITGFWQISSRSDGDVNVQQRLDTYYIRNWSPWLDAYILARTAVIVLLCKGAY